MIVPENVLDEMARKLKKQNRRIAMPRAKKKTTTRKKRTTQKTKEFPFFTRVVDGAKKLFSPPK